MAELVRDVMTQDVVALPRTAALTDAARRMKEKDVGDVIVLEGENMCGVVTDRDIVVRALADGRDPSATTLGDVCSREVVSVAPDDSVDHAAHVMRERAVRRLPVTEGAKPVGVISLGDLAIEEDSSSPLADISAAKGNN
jgi:CBS domain-containing protein